MEQKRYSKIMPKNYKSDQPNIPYFLTFTVVEWQPIFVDEKYCSILWRSLQHCRENKGLRLHAFVFMTNHIHLIASAGSPQIHLWEIIRDFKKFTSQTIIRFIQKDRYSPGVLDIFSRAGAKNPLNTRHQLWIQDDGAKEIVSESFLHQKVDYLHQNPVRAGLVTEAKAYYWSSARLIEADDYGHIDRIE